MIKLKRIKSLFLIFLKQFKIEEIKILMKYLELVVHEYNNTSLKLIDLLSAEEKDDDDGFAAVCSLPRILKAESLTSFNESFHESSGEDALSKQLQQVFFKKDSRTPSAFAGNKCNLIGDRDDDERAAINALAKLSDSFTGNNDDEAEEAPPSARQASKKTGTASNYSRVSSVHLNLNGAGSECDEDDECESDYVTAATNNDDLDWSSYGFLSTMSDDEEEDEDDTAADASARIDDDGTYYATGYDCEGNAFQDDPDDYEFNVKTAYLNSHKKKPSTENLRNSNGRIRKFSDSIRMELEKHFQKNRYISGDEKKMLADKLNLTVRQVQKWFVHRREKFRRHEKNHGKKPTYKQPSAQFNDFDDDDEYGGELENGNDLDENIKQEKLDFNNGDEGDEDVEEDDDEMDIVEGGEDDDVNENGEKFTPYIENYLEKLFRKKQQLTQRDVNSVCLNLNLKPNQIRLWFKQRRQRQQQVQRNYFLKNGPKKKVRIIEYQQQQFDNENDASNDLDLNKRQNYPDHVLKQLENAFIRNQYISGDDKRILSRKLGLAPIQIERWFYTRRKKFHTTNS